MNAPAGRFDAVVFDLGGVLIDWNPRYLYRQLFAGDEAAMERFLAEVCTQDWNERQDAGRGWDEAIAGLSARHPQHAPLIEAYRARWEEMLGGPLQDSVAVLGELRGRGVPLYALTNWSQETFPIALRRFDFLDWFGGIVVSGRERLCKPDPAIFRLLLARFALAAERTVYIDDAPRNVEAARRLGMHAIAFRDAARLRAALCDAGLLRVRGEEGA
ncbi:HAD family hydrolase [Frateuria sp. Soil773]|uniref:HAD family hydrolase n=1 Tax=Frateuria sp. Soil773 TaxID=1736407 RepID=UPI0006F210F0|nr:HAD family phosphatase [Frateuria sp. Soil773]KRE95011.1 HAD family hydrolase [Frateuria sp. Soil773]